MRLHLAASTYLLLAFAGCADRATDDLTANAQTGSPCLSCRYCAIASFDGPAFYAQNFWDYDEAKQFLSTLNGAATSEIASGPCDAALACPDSLVADPLCAQVSGEDKPRTFGDACELLAATRHAAGNSEPGAAKGGTLHAGTCEEDACAGKQCGDECPSMYGSPLPTYCTGDGQCRPGKPVCEATYDCDLSHALCDAFTPQCKDGETPSIVNGCYGPCVPIAQCSGVAQ